ncbi:MAG: hypothetical protein IJI58_04275 [Bacilli bacterium]|nr:hypothetical protein [Bacilli bacterium]
MRIGIDLDETICNTSKIINEYINEYATEEKIDPNQVMLTKRDDFFNKYTIDIFENVEIKPYVSEVLNRLKDSGHVLYAITARSGELTSKQMNIVEPTTNWFEKHNIKIDKLITNSYHEEKAEACLKNKIDIMIDDDINNCQELEKVGIKYILFDDKNKYNIENKVTNWLDVEKIIERNE